MRTRLAGDEGVAGRRREVAVTGTSPSPERTAEPGPVSWLDLRTGRVAPAGSSCDSRVPGTPGAQRSTTPTSRRGHDTLSVTMLFTGLRFNLSPGVRGADHNRPVDGSPDSKIAALWCRLRQSRVTVIHRRMFLLRAFCGATRSSSASNNVCRRVRPLLSSISGAPRACQREREQPRHLRYDRIFSHPLPGLRPAGKIHIEYCQLPRSPCHTWSWWEMSLLVTTIPAIPSARHVSMPLSPGCLPAHAA